MSYLQHRPLYRTNKIWEDNQYYPVKQSTENNLQDQLNLLKEQLQKANHPKEPWDAI